MYFVCVVVGEYVSDLVYVCRGRQRNNSPICMSGSVLGNCGTMIHIFWNLLEIERTKYVHLNELISGRTKDAFPGLHQGNNLNTFVGGFVTNQLL